MGNNYIFIFIYKNACACIEATSLKHRQSIPLVTPRIMEIHGKMAEYDCILFGSFFINLEMYFLFLPLCSINISISYLGRSIMSWPMSSPQSSSSGLFFALLSVLMQKPPNMHEGINHFLCFVGRTNTCNYYTKHHSSASVRYAENLFFI